MKDRIQDTTLQSPVLAKDNLPENLRLPGTVSRISRFQRLQLLANAPVLLAHAQGCTLEHEILRLQLSKRRLQAAHIPLKLAHIRLQLLWCHEYLRLQLVRLRYRWLLHSLTKRILNRRYKQDK